VSQTAAPQLTQTAGAGDTATYGAIATGTGIYNASATSGFSMTSTYVSVQSTSIVSTVVNDPLIAGISTAIGNSGNSIVNASGAISTGIAPLNTAIAMNNAGLGNGAIVVSGTPVSPIGFANDWTAGASDFISYVKGIGLLGNNKIAQLLIFLMVIVFVVGLILLFPTLLPLISKLFQFIFRVLAWIFEVLGPLVEWFLLILSNPVVLIIIGIVAILLVLKACSG
jgi:hypothetical protein